MYMQRHMNREGLGEIRPIQLVYSVYTHNFFKFYNDTWDIQADDLSQADSTFCLMPIVGTVLTPILLVRVNLTLDDPYGPFNTSNVAEMQDLFQRLVQSLV